MPVFGSHGNNEKWFTQLVEHSFYPCGTYFSSGHASNHLSLDRREIPSILVFLSFPINSGDAGRPTSPNFPRPVLCADEFLENDVFFRR